MKATHKIRCWMTGLAMLALGLPGARQSVSPASGASSADATAATDARDDSAEAERSAEEKRSATAEPAQEQEKNPETGLVIATTELPTAYPQAPFHFRLEAKGNYVPVLHWSVVKGALPPGVKLRDDGALEGAPKRTGEFQFTVAVSDGGQPAQAVQRPLVLKVVDAFTIAWKDQAHVNGNRIEGSVEVSNAMPEDVDLTFDVKAVAQNGRATEIGYQHFVLTKGTIGMALPFGETLPNGGYLVNVNVVGEVPKRNAIYRQMLQTPRPLHVTVGP
jgi:hypothetical protein